LLHSNRGIPQKEAELAEIHEVLTVDVDDSVLKELKESFVGVLALQVEVRKIRTTLYMEGLAHFRLLIWGEIWCYSSVLVKGNFWLCQMKNRTG
jgi:hypothetical protein